MKEYNRAPYEFSPLIKNEVRRDQRYRCAITGRKSQHLEVHHILPIGVALGFWPRINPQILNQRENAVGLSPEIHKQLHDEMHEWPKEFFKLYVIGVYSYLRDELEKEQVFAAVGD